MSREVCGICWCPYDEAGKCGCAPPCATQECMPSGCPNCASLEAQNTELDKKLADLEQTSLELCETCGWRTLIPGDCCLNCTRSDPDELTVAYTIGAHSRMRTLNDEIIAELWHKNAGYHHHFARAIERWLKGEQ